MARMLRWEHVSNARKNKNFAEQFIADGDEGRYVIGRRPRTNLWSASLNLRGIHLEAHGTLTKPMAIEWCEKTELGLEL